MNERRRYDTAALVDELRKDRLRTIILLFVGFAIIGVLVIVYATTLRRSRVTLVPAEVVAPVGPKPAPTAAVPATPESATPKVTPVDPLAPAPPKVPELAKGAFVLALPRFATLTIDDQRIPLRGKAPVVELLAGEHRVKIVVGKKRVTQTVTLGAGDRLEMRLDKKGKLQLTRQLPRL